MEVIRPPPYKIHTRAMAHIDAGVIAAVEQGAEGAIDIEAAYF